MLRINVAPDQFAKNRWIVHLFARDGDEHIYQFTADRPSAAARMALDGYDAKRAGLIKIVQVLDGPVVCNSTEIGHYPGFTYTQFTVDG